MRIPAAFNGVSSLKPTHTRLSYRKVANVIPGQTTYASTVGVIGTSLDAIHLVFRSVLLTQPWLRDPNVVPMPWRDDRVEETLSRAETCGKANDNRPLKFGIFWTDGVVNPQPPVTRGLNLVVDAKALVIRYKPFTFFFWRTELTEHTSSGRKMEPPRSEFRQTCPCKCRRIKPPTGLYDANR